MKSSAQAENGGAQAGGANGHVHRVRYYHYFPVTQWSRNYWKGIIVKGLLLKILMGITPRIPRTDGNPTEGGDLVCED